MALNNPYRSRIDQEMYATLVSDLKERGQLR
jgi:hypothetical protein